MSWVVTFVDENGTEYGDIIDDADDLGHFIRANAHDIGLAKIMQVEKDAIAVSFMDKEWES